MNYESLIILTMLLSKRQSAYSKAADRIYRYILKVWFLFTKSLSLLSRYIRWYIASSIRTKLKETKSEANVLSKE